MTQTNNRFFDEAARLMNDAAGVAQGVRREFDTLLRTQAERILNDLDVVKDVVYTLRFDRGSALYGEFGRFFVGYLDDIENLV